MVSLLCDAVNFRVIDSYFCFFFQRTSLILSEKEVVSPQNSNGGNLII